MLSSAILSFYYTLCGLVLLKFATAGDGLSQEYCSSENTGSSYVSVYNHFQSNGACFTQCKSQYAFAVVQNATCWCSDYIPATQDDTSGCSETCPGFPDDLCGNEPEGLYGYIRIPGNPISGTAGFPSSTSVASSMTVSLTSNSESPNPPSPIGTRLTTTLDSTHSDTSTSTSRKSASLLPSQVHPPDGSPSLSSRTLLTSEISQTPTQAPTSAEEPVTSYVSQTIFHTITQVESPSQSVVVSYVTPTQVTTTTADPSTTAPTTSSTSSVSSSLSSSTVVPVVASTPSISSSVSGTLVTSVRVVTVSGARVTETVTSVPTIPPLTSNVHVAHKNLSSGAIAGIVIGSVIGLALLILAAWLLWRRSKNPDSEGCLKLPNRTTSTRSRTGLITRGRPQSMAEVNNNTNNHNHNYDDVYVNPGTGNNSTRHSMFFGAGAAGDGVSPVSPLDSASMDNEPTIERRPSRPFFYDQRLNPTMLIADENGSRVSIQDQRDYSRSLGVVNPDVRPSFESRISAT